jgi:hypothetical protein
MGLTGASRNWLMFPSQPQREADLQTPGRATSWGGFEDLGRCIHEEFWSDTLAALMLTMAMMAHAEVVVQIDKSRLHPANASALFTLVALNGARNTTIEIANQSMI